MKTTTTFQPVFLLLLAAAPATHAFPRFIVNSCARDLTVGQVIMGQAVLPSSQADDPDQQHTIDVLDRAGQSVCGGSVEQGESLRVAIDDGLLSSSAQYIIEATESFLDNTSTQDVGCDYTRAANAGTMTVAYPLQGNGETMTVRLLSAYGFGQVYASPQCDITVTGSRSFVAPTGYLVDNASLQRDRAAVLAAPYSMTVEQLLLVGDQGYSIVVPTNNNPTTFAVEYSITSAPDVARVVSYLESLSSLTDSDIQVSLRAFETTATTNPELERIVSIDACADAETCPEFYTVVQDNSGDDDDDDEEEEEEEEVCFQDGFCIESSIVDEAAGTITVTVTNEDDAWFAVGFTTTNGGMTGGGAGSDIFACSSDEGLQRYNPVTARRNPANLGVTQEVLANDLNGCEIFADGTGGRMTFTRTLEGFREIVPGTASPMIFARGPVGDDGSFTAQHPNDRRGQVAIDLTDISGGVTQVRLKPEWALWCHIVFMSVSWGLCLPLAVVIASRTRNNNNEIPGAKNGAWFMWHRSLAGMGWLFQTLGLVFILYYVEDSVEGNHWTYEHSKLGLFVAIAGFLQPISALLRPHEPKEGWPNGKKSVFRLAFEIYHKGVGWSAMICGMVNIFLGAKLVRDLDFESVVSTVPISVGSAGCGLFALYFILCVVMPNNPISRAITFASKEEPEQAKEQARRIPVSVVNEQAEQNV